MPLRPSWSGAAVAKSRSESSRRSADAQADEGSRTTKPSRSCSAMLAAAFLPLDPTATEWRLCSLPPTTRTVHSTPSDDEPTLGTMPSPSSTPRCCCCCPCGRCHLLDTSLMRISPLWGHGRFRPRSLETVITDRVILHPDRGSEQRGLDRDVERGVMSVFLGQGPARRQAPVALLLERARGSWRSLSP
jgi:hypothetical protein